MKKLLLLALVMIGGVINVNAADDLYLRSDFDGTNHWNSDDAALKFTYVGYKDETNEDVYTYTINASDISATDIWFRLHIPNWGAQICPYTSSGSYTFDLENQRSKTYGAKYEKGYFQGDQLSFGISHHTIKASQYKITVFRGYSEQYYEGENCRVMWIEVEILSVPASISSLGYSTFSSAYPVDFTDVTDVTAYRAEQTLDNKVLLKKVTGKVAASTGLVLKGTTTTIPTTDSGTSYNLQTSDTNYLMASVNATTITPQSGTSDFYYFLSGTSSTDVGFYQLENNNTYTSAAGKAYYHTPTPLDTGNGTRAAWIFEGEETQGINTVESTQNADIVYDLQGRVAKTTKAGLYIKNGKKVIMK